MLNKIKNLNNKNFIFNNLEKKKNFSKKKNFCEVCSSDECTDLLNFGRVGKNCKYDYLPVSFCNACELRFLNPRPTDKYFKAYYVSSYRKKNNNNLPLDDFFDKSQIKRGQAVYNFFKNKINFKKGRMLDHGCAIGLTMLAWKQSGWSVTGIDPNHESVVYAKKKFKLNVKKYFGENMPKFKKKFNVILSLGSLEHSYDINKTLNKIKLNLIKNGNLIVRWRSDKMIGSPFEYYNINHFRYFTRYTWEILLRKNGFGNINYFNKKIEGSDAYEYILCTSQSKVKNKKNISKKNYSNYFFKYIKKYKMQSEMLNNKTSKFNYNIVDNFVKRNKIGLLFLKRKDALKRFYKETKSFNRYYKKYYENKNR